MEQSRFRFEKGIEMTCKGPGSSISLSHTFGSRLLLQKKPAIPLGMAGFFLAIGKLMEFPWRFICKLDCDAVFKVFIHRLNANRFLHFTRQTLRWRCTRVSDHPIPQFYSAWLNGALRCTDFRRFQRYYGPHFQSSGRAVTRA